MYESLRNLLKDQNNGVFPFEIKIVIRDREHALREHKPVIKHRLKNAIAVSVCARNAGRVYQVCGCANKTHKRERRFEFFKRLRSSCKHAHNTHRRAKVEGKLVDIYCPFGEGH